MNGTTFGNYGRDYGANARFERRHPDLREEIQVMIEADGWTAAVAAGAPQPSLLARLWQRTTTRLAA
jgi:hypothetical protein